MMTNYYLTRMKDRLIEDVMFEKKECNITRESADKLISNIKAECVWAKQKLRGNEK